MTIKEFKSQILKNIDKTMSTDISSKDIYILISPDIKGIKSSIVKSEIRVRAKYLTGYVKDVLITPSCVSFSANEVKTQLNNDKPLSMENLYTWAKSSDYYDNHRVCVRTLDGKNIMVDEIQFGKSSSNYLTITLKTTF